MNNVASSTIFLMKVINLVSQKAKGAPIMKALYQFLSNLIVTNKNTHWYKIIEFFVISIQNQLHV